MRLFAISTYSGSRSIPMNCRPAFIADRMTDELQSRGYPAHTRLKQIKHRTRKELRIEALLPDIQKGKVRFHRKFRNSPELEQFTMYPMHQNDDFP